MKPREESRAVAAAIDAANQTTVDAAEGTADGILDNRAVKALAEEAWDGIIDAMRYDPRGAIAQVRRSRRAVGAGRFRSWLNALLIGFQTHGWDEPRSSGLIATPKQWARWGRTVKPDARPIVVAGTFTSYDGEGRRALWMRGYVEFDYVDTDGRPLPKRPDPPEILEADPAKVADLLRALERVRTNPRIGDPITLRDEPFSTVWRPLGCTNGTSIWLDPSLAGEPTQHARIYSHELAHCLAHFRKGQPGEPLEDGAGLPGPGARPQIEVEADAIACLVCAAHDVDVVQHVRHYLSWWSTPRVDHERARSVIRKTASRLLSLAHEPRSMEPGGAEAAGAEPEDTLNP